MKKIIFYLGVCLFISFLAFSCAKNAVETQTQSEKFQSLDDFDTDEDEMTENEKEIAEQQKEEDLENAYDADASKNMKINSVLPTTEGQVRGSGDGNCLKYGGQVRVFESDNNTFKIRGVNLGAAQGDSLTIKAFYSRRKIDTIIPLTILSWSDTMISLRANAIKFSSKNIYLKFWITNTKTLKVKKKGVRCVASINDISEMTGLDQITNYPSAIWEVVNQQQERGFSGPYERDEITSYKTTLKAGDILIRQGWTQDSNKDVGIIINVDPAVNSKGEKKILVYERNMNCKGTLQKKTYLFNKTTGVFNLKTGETLPWKECLKTE